MDKNTCLNEDTYFRDGRCCKRCLAGSYVQADCDGTEETQCKTCEDGFYTATKNHLKFCQLCSVCSSDNNQRKAEDCTVIKNTVCECEAGFFCNNDRCDHCLPVTHCHEGEGVKFLATRTNDTVCAPCDGGTYSNVTDFLSPCRAYTRCEDIGRKLKIPGTRTSDAVCTDLHRCSWVLPAALWSGLVLTALVLFAVLICWRAKRKFYKSLPVVQIVPAPPVKPLDLPLPSEELNGYCPESCDVEKVDVVKLPLFETDGHVVSCDTDSSLPITPLKHSVSFAESSPITAAFGQRVNTFFRTHSEPQEDEWCGT